MWKLSETTALLCVYVYSLSYDRIYRGFQPADKFVSWLKIYTTNRILDSAIRALDQRGLIVVRWNESNGTANSIDISDFGISALDRWTTSIGCTAKQLQSEVDNGKHRTSDFYLSALEFVDGNN